MRLLLREWRSLSLTIAAGAVLALAGWAIRYRVAVETQFYAQNSHPAVWHLRRTLGPDEVSVLHDILVSDPDPKRRRLAAHRLSLEADPRSVPLLTNAMGDADPGVRESAYNALGVNDDRGGAFVGWLRELSDRKLLEFVRDTSRSSVQWGLFRNIVHDRRPLMVAAGEALLGTTPSVDKMSLIVLSLDSMSLADFTPEEKSVIARLMRLGVDDSDARFRRVCRSRVALLDAGTMTEQELVDWAMDLADAEYVIECDDILALLTELNRRAPARFDDTVAKLLATARPSGLPWKLLGVVRGLLDPVRRATLMRAALANPDESFRESVQFSLERAEDDLRESRTPERDEGR